MDSLAQLGAFLGIATGSMQLARIGGSTDITLVNARSLVRSIPFPDRSLGAMIDAVSRLPELTLTATLTGPRRDAAPLVTTITVDPAPSGTWWTRVSYELGGAHVSWTDIAPAGGPVSTPSLSPGTWTLGVERAGVGPSGPVSRRVPIEVVATGQDQRKPPDGPNNGGGNNGGGGNNAGVPTCDVTFITFENAAQKLRIGGRGFAFPEDVEILVDGAVSTAVPTTDQLGSYGTYVGVLVSFPEVEHTFQARGAHGRSTPIVRRKI